MRLGHGEADDAVADLIDLVGDDGFRQLICDRVDIPGDDEIARRLPAPSLASGPITIDVTPARLTLLAAG